MYALIVKQEPIPWYIYDVEYSRLPNNQKILYIQESEDDMRGRLEFIFCFNRSQDEKDTEMRIYLVELGIAQSPLQVNPKLLQVLEELYEMGMDDR